MKAWDTNLLVRHLLEDDAEQLAIVRDELTTAERRNQKIWLSQISLVETAWVLGSHLGKTEVLDTLGEVIADSRFAVQDAPVVAAAIERARTRGDLPEHLTAQSALSIGCERTQTFDKDVRRFPEFEVLPDE